MTASSSSPPPPALQACAQPSRSGLHNSVCNCSTVVDTLGLLLFKTPQWPPGRRPQFPPCPSPSSLLQMSGGQTCYNVTTRHPLPAAAASAWDAPWRAAGGWPCSQVALCRPLPPPLVLLCSDQLLPALMHLQIALAPHCCCCWFPCRRQQPGCFEQAGHLALLSLRKPAARAAGPGCCLLTAMLRPSCASPTAAAPAALLAAVELPSPPPLGCCLPPAALVAAAALMMPLLLLLPAAAAVRRQQPVLSRPPAASAAPE